MVTTVAAVMAVMAVMAVTPVVSMVSMFLGRSIVLSPSWRTVVLRLPVTSLVLLLTAVMVATATTQQTAQQPTA